MASAFDGLGLGYLGSERTRFKTGEPSLGMALAGIGLQQAGIIDNLNDLGNPQAALRKKILGAFAPDQGRAINDGNKGYQPSQNVWEAAPGSDVNQNAAAMIPPAIDASVQPPPQIAPGVAPSPAPEKTIDQHVDDVIPKFSPVSQNTLTPRDASQDQQILAMASQPAPPPNAPIGQQQGGGGQIMQAVLPQLAKLLFA
jgi:hypothetical protein